MDIYFILARNFEPFLLKTTSARNFEPLLWKKKQLEIIRTVDDRNGA